MKTKLQDVILMQSHKKTHIFERPLEKDYRIFTIHSPMDFCPICSDRHESDELSRSHKRRKFQPAPSAMKAETNTALEHDELSSMPWNAESDHRQLQIMTIQLNNDLPLFIERAKQLFSDNNIDDHDIAHMHTCGTPGASFQARRKEFVGQAIKAYLQHFLQASASQQLLEIASQIFSVSFLSDASTAEVDNNISTTTRHQTIPMMPSTASYMASSLEPMTFESGLNYFESSNQDHYSF